MVLYTGPRADKPCIYGGSVNVSHPPCYHKLINLNHNVSTQLNTTKMAVNSHHAIMGLAHPIIYYYRRSYDVYIPTFMTYDPSCDPCKIRGLGVWFFHNPTHEDKGPCPLPELQKTFLTYVKVARYPHQSCTKLLTIRPQGFEETISSHETFHAFYP